MTDRLDEYLRLLLKWNRPAGLTAFENREEALAKGVIPSLAAEPWLRAGWRVIDAGSGGGFPAIPLALKRPDLRWTLVEPKAAKAAFLREAARHLGLEAEVIEASLEALLAGKQRRWDAATMRGLRLRKGPLKRLVRALTPGGRILVWSAGDRASEYQLWFEEFGLAGKTLPTGQQGLVLLSGDVPRGTPEAPPMR
ncbi:MAG: 16S rRNA (guanine(527)-N(7))-methyltransferase RsmG [Acidobacteriota bacterium]